MSYKVLLVNRYFNGSHQQYPVSGRSGKFYGTAFNKPEKGGLVLELSAEDYERDKVDLVGNTAIGQQWVPEFVELEPVKDVKSQIPERFRDIAIIDKGTNGQFVKDVRDFLAKQKMAALQAIAKSAGLKMFHASREKLIDAIYELHVGKE